MKKIFIVIFIFPVFAIGLSAQSNWPMATEVNTQETQTQNTPVQPEQRITVLRFTWESARQMAFRESQIIILRASDSSVPLPPPSFFKPEVPQGVILASIPLSEQEKAGGIAIKLSLTPLVIEDFNLPARMLQYQDVRCEIPALHIRVTGR